MVLARLTVDTHGYHCNLVMYSKECRGLNAILLTDKEVTAHAAAPDPSASMYPRFTQDARVHTV